MFYEVRPSLIFLAKSEAVSSWTSLVVNLGLVLLPRVSKSCRISVRVTVHGRMTLGSVISAWGAFLPWYSLSWSSRKARLHLLLSQVPRQGPNSPSNITSLMNKGTPNPSILPSSRVNYKWNRTCLGKGDIKYPGLMGRSERGDNYSSKTGHLLKFEQASPHSSWESPWKLALSSYPQPPGCNSLGTLVIFVVVVVHTKNHYRSIPKILVENSYPESLTGTISESPWNFQSVLWANRKGTEKVQVRWGHVEVLIPHRVTLRNVLEQPHSGQKEESEPDSRERVEEKVSIQAARTYDWDHISFLYVSSEQTEKSESMQLFLVQTLPFSHTLLCAISLQPTSYVIVDIVFSHCRYLVH